MYIGKGPDFYSKKYHIPDDMNNIEEDVFYLLVPSFFFEEPSEISRKKNKARFSSLNVESIKNYHCSNDSDIDSLS